MANRTAEQSASPVGAGPFRPAPPPPEPTREELAARLAAIRREMANDRVDFVVLTSQSNIEYVTAYRTLSWSYNARPLFCVIAPHELLLIANRIEARLVESKDRDFQPAYYDGFLAEGAEAIEREISGRDKTASADVAIDYGQDMFGRGSLDIIDRLRNRGDGTNVISAANLLWRVRMIKSPFEADLKRTSFRIVNEAFDAVVAEATMGVSEIDLNRRLQARIFMNGAERADPIAMVFSRGKFLYSQPPRARTLKNGHYIWTDFRSTYGGYPADRNRIARAGLPEPWEVEAYEKTRSLTIALASGVRAGMTCGDLYATFERLWNDAGLGPVYELASRIGHGGGLDVTEPPSISKGNTERIMPGMILHLEPKLEHGGAVFQFEEVIYVRENGVEFLSDLSPERIPVIL